MTAGCCSEGVGYNQSKCSASHMSETACAQACRAMTNTSFYMVRNGWMLLWQWLGYNLN